MELKKEDIIKDVERALNEDVGTGDVTASLIPVDLIGEAKIISREPMLVCGKPWVEETFHRIDKDIHIHWEVDEGEWRSEPSTLCFIKGRAQSILTAERTALNFMQTLSATATETYHYLLQLQGLHTRLLDTRKTLPGLRVAQKYAVACAGGMNHRFGLYDAYLIKENHILVAGSITKAINKAREAGPHLMIEVEVETLAEFEEAIECKPDRIMLDNFSLPMMVQAVSMNQPKQCELEVSGGIGLDNIRSVAETAVDYISVGAITKSIRAIDLSLLFIKDK